VARTVLRIITRLNRGGPLRQLQALVPELTRLGWQGPVLAGRVEAHEPDGTADLRAAGAEVVTVRALGRGLDPSKDPRAFKALLAAIRHTKPDLVHTHTAKAGALGRLAARLCGVPAVHTFHGHHFEQGLFKAAAARFAERRLAPFTDAAIALTARQRRDLVEVHRVLPAAKVRVIAPGMDLAAFRRQARARLPDVAYADVAEGVPRFLWTGRFVPVKAPRLLVEAVARTRVPLHVTMLGRGPLLRPVRSLIRARRMEHRIACPGPVANVAPWLAAADALVLCSRSEGAPLSIVEALALGKPAIVSTVGGVPDLVTHEGDGLWVPPGDPLALAAALARMATDATLRQGLGRAAAAGVDERFGGARLAQETAALYEEVLATRSRAGAGGPKSGGGE